MSKKYTIQFNCQYKQREKDIFLKPYKHKSELAREKIARSNYHSRNKIPFKPLATQACVVLGYFSPGSFT